MYFLDIKNAFGSIDVDKACECVKNKYDIYERFMFLIKRFLTNFVA